MGWPKGKKRVVKKMKEPVREEEPKKRKLREPVREPVTDDKPKREPVPSEDAMADPKVNKAIENVVAAIRKKFGDDAIHRFDEMEHDVKTFTTGIAVVDKALGGGFPLAKLVQISGKESVGKSSFCKWLIAQAQAQGIICYFIDTELSPDSIERAQSFGVDVHGLMWSECLYLEDAFERAALLIDKMKSSITPVLIFIDSIAAADMKSSANRDFDESGRRAEKASFLSANLPKLVQPLSGTNIGIVFVNQMRTTANASPFSDPDYEPGGRALAHWCHLILRMSNLGRIKTGDVARGMKARIKVKKSKICVPFKQADISIMFDGKMAGLEDGVDDGD